MPIVNLFLSAEQHAKLVAKKKELDMNWVDFVMQLVKE